MTAPEKIKGFPKTLLFFLLFLFAAWTLRELPFKSAAPDTPLWPDTLISGAIKTLIWAVPALFLISRANKEYKLSITSKEMFGSMPDNIWFFLLAALALAAYIIIGNLVRNKELLFKEIIPAVAVEGVNQIAWSTLFSGVIVAAITEELVFRGFCYNILAKVWGHEDAAWVSALLFTLIHIPRWVQQGLFTSLWVIPRLCYIFVLGMLFAMTMRKTRSIWPPIILHMINNGLADILMLS